MPQAPAGRAWAAARGTLLAALIAATATTAGCLEDGPRTGLGDPMPHFAGVDMDGQPFDSDELDGQIAVLHFLVAGAELDQGLGLDVMQEVVDESADVPGVTFVTIYRSFEQSHTPQQDWEANGQRFNVTWRVLPDPGQALGQALGLGPHGDAFAAVFGREGTLKATTQTSPKCLKDTIHALHQDPSHPETIC